jgi:xanthine permease XanP
LISGVGTFIQARRVGPIGSGLICVQGTSFAFLGTILATGFTVKATGGGNDEVLATIFAVCFLAAFVEIFISFFIEKLGKVIKPVVTGVVITTIGVYLIKVGMTDIGGGQWLLTNMPEKFASPSNLIVGFSVVALVVLLNASKNQWVRLTAVVVAMLVGWLLALILGIAKFKMGEFDLIAMPLPFKYGFNIDFGAMIAFSFLYLITAIESTGDITAKCAVPKIPVKGASYLARIRGGILGTAQFAVISPVDSMAVIRYKKLKAIMAPKSILKPYLKGNGMAIKSNSPILNLAIPKISASNHPTNMATTTAVSLTH